MHPEESGKWKVSVFNSTLQVNLVGAETMSLCGQTSKSTALVGKCMPQIPRIVPHGAGRLPNPTVRCGSRARGYRNEKDAAADHPIRVGRRETILRGVSTVGVCGCASCCGNNRGGWYDKYFAYALSHTMDKYEGLITPTKDKLFAKLQASGAKNILEVGVGYGPNARYYGNSEEFAVTGLDPNPAMEPYANEMADSVGLKDFTFLESYAENIPVETSTFDAAVCTLVLCSVSSVSDVLKEIQRVVKPGGMFFFIEHVAAPPGTFAAIGQKVLDPVQGLVADGCHLNRNTLESISKASFSEIEAERFEIPDLGILSNHIWGVATV
ncbi:hypothetical protein BSKO_10738 [Bryopsis sp. KO-2023]|nr:hypothetical protein BSKO_10738 [Bryopsis sp. KO-2023]